MTEALNLWRLAPTQIEGALSRYHRRSIREWLRADFTMSSRELLALLDETPEHSRFREALERTFWLGEIVGPGEHHGKLVKVRAVGRVPRDVKVLATFVDWTAERKMAARATLELAWLRTDGGAAEPDPTGLIEPLEMLLAQRRNTAATKVATLGADHILAGLHGSERR